MIATTKGQKAFQVFDVVFMIALAFVTLYPFYYVAVASFSNAAEFMKFQGLLYKPVGFTTAAYRYVLRNDMILRGFLNTGLLIVTRVSLAMLLTIIGSYVLSRKQVLWKPVFMFLIVFTMFFSGGIIPLYLLVKELSLTNTIWAVILPSALNTFYMIITRNFFQSLPAALEESAEIDGAGNLTILFRIYLPLAMPILATIALFYAVDRWNEWYSAMIFIRTPTLTPLQLVLRSIVIESQIVTGETTSAGAEMGQSKFALGTKMAAVFISMVPIMAVYPFLQKYFVKGVLIGAVKA